MGVLEYYNYLFDLGVKFDIFSFVANKEGNHDVWIYIGEERWRNPKIGDIFF